MINNYSANRRNPLFGNKSPLIGTNFIHKFSTNSNTGSWEDHICGRNLCQFVLICV